MVLVLGLKNLKDILLSQKFLFGFIYIVYILLLLFDIITTFNAFERGRPETNIIVKFLMGNKPVCPPEVAVPYLIIAIVIELSIVTCTYYKFYKVIKDESFKSLFTNLYALRLLWVLPFLTYFYSHINGISVNLEPVLGRCFGT